MITKLQLTVAKFEGEIDAVKGERGHLRGQLGYAQKTIGELRERAAAAEAKLEQFAESAVINVVHSQAVQDGREDYKPPRWQFWRR